MFQCSRAAENFTRNPGGRMSFLPFLLIGAAAGIASGLFGIGGGIIIVPALVLLFGFTQQAASGTSLVAFLLPVGILGVWQYYRSGLIGAEHLRFGLLIAAGIFVGTFFGARLAGMLSPEVGRKVFAVFLLLVSAKLWFNR